MKSNKFKILTFSFVMMLSLVSCGGDEEKTGFGSPMFSTFYSKIIF